MSPKLAEHCLGPEELQHAFLSSHVLGSSEQRRLLGTQGMVLDEVRASVADVPAGVSEHKISARKLLMPAASVIDLGWCQNWRFTTFVCAGSCGVRCAGMAGSPIMQTWEVTPPQFVSCRNSFHVSWTSRESKRVRMAYLGFTRNDWVSLKNFEQTIIERRINQYFNSILASCRVKFSVVRVAKSFLNHTLVTDDSLNSIVFLVCNRQIATLQSLNPYVPWTVRVIPNESEVVPMGSEVNLQAALSEQHDHE